MLFYFFEKILFLEILFWNISLLFSKKYFHALIVVSTAIPKDNPELLAAKKAKGKAKVLLFERGLGGNVFTTLIGDIDRNEGRAFNNTDMNYENAVYSIEDQRLAYNRQFTNQILNMPLRSYAPFGTYLLSAAANTTGAYMMTQAPSTPKAGVDQGLKVAP